MTGARREGSRELPPQRGFRKNGSHRLCLTEGIASQPSSSLSDPHFLTVISLGLFNAFPWGAVAHTSNPSTWEAEAGRLPRVRPT